MQLSSIKQFLEVYRKNIDTEDEKRKKILRILKEEAGVLIDEKSLVIKKGVVQIKASAVFKNEIFLHKEKIIHRLRDSKELSVYDITTQ